MAKTARILKDGRKMDYVATATTANGDVVVVGDIVGVSHSDLTTDEVGAMDYTGTIEITGTTADVFVQGKICYFDTTNKVALAVNGGSDPILGVVTSGKLATVAGVISVDLGVRV